jgi:ABC-2 type transport system permease protein
MKVIPILVLSILRLSYRVRIAFFFSFIFPLLISFAYFQIFAHGVPSAVARMVAPLISLTMMSNALLVAGMRQAGMRERDMFRQYHLTPVRAIDLVLSDMIVGYLTFIPVLAIQLAVAICFYHAPLGGYYVGICAICTLGYFTLSALGLLLSTSLNTGQEAAVVTQLLFFVLMFISGTTMPLSELPRFVQHIAMFTPPAIIIVSLEAAMGGGTLLHSLPEVFALSLSCVTAIGVTALIFRWDKDEKVSRRNRLRALLALVPILILGILLNSGWHARWGTQATKKVISSLSFAQR